MPSLPPTITSALTEEWAINDEVVRLREWGTDRVHPLFTDRPGPFTIGTASTCEVQIRDKTRRVSREHAHLQRIQGRWTVLDRSKHGLYRDGAKLDKLVLVPGVEIGLGGGVTLVAESARSIALRNFLSRILGWSTACAEAVDLALRATRLAARRRAILVLCGHDLVPLAEELHRLTLTSARPFVLCNPRRRTSETAGNPTRCASSGLAALEEAAAGTVCLWAKLLPSDLRDLLAALRRPGCQTQLVVCSESTRDAELFHAIPVVIPPVASRRDEIDRIVEEYAVESAASLGMGELRLDPTERAWIRRHLHTLPDIQKATLRLAAIRQAGSISAGALRLGISHVAMLKWLRSHAYPGLAKPRDPDAPPR
ncbi:MAG TPA: FHA domain-containing protein [Kofleriaceae bacterium]|nr:FHA domain-containing protein [Kofleriaceae bacterium]